ncbi:MAG TPA: Ig-like domain-containing protein [Roseiarcus sp.]|jgi:nucleoid-associated protein YgaU
MLSQRTLIWVGAAAFAVAAATAGAVVWVYPDLFRLNGASPAPPPVVASAPAEPKPASAPKAPPDVQTAAPAAKSPPAPDKAPSQAVASPVGPAFDVVNVDPSGDAVIAGRAAPNAKVELRDAGKTVAEATADDAGQFVIVPSAPLAPGDHSLSLAAKDEKAGPETSKTVSVSVAAPQAKVAVPNPPPEAKTAALPPANAPAAPLATRNLAKPSSPAGARVAIQTVEADAAGGLIARGLAEPNAIVRLYLNDADVADARTKADGRWSLTIKNGMIPGSYLMRADEINPGQAAVVASVNTPFDYPEAPAPASPAMTIAGSPSPEPSSSTSPADPVIESVQTKRVATGHTLWELSRNYYGDPTRYQEIYQANKWEIHNPNLIFPGQVVVVPKSQPKP